MKTIAISALIICQAAIAAPPLGVGPPGGSSNAGTGGTVRPIPAGIPGGSSNSGTGGTIKPTPIGIPGGSPNAGTGDAQSPIAAHGVINFDDALLLDSVLFPRGLE